MLRQSVVNLIEVVRSFGLSAVETGRGRRVRLGLPQEDFPQRMLDLHDALEDFDADAGNAHQSEEVEKMRQALTDVMRFAIIRGIPQDDIEAVVRQSVTGKSKSGQELSPRYEMKRPSKKWKPKLSVPGNRLAFLGKDSYRRRMRSDVERVLQTMGSAAPDVSKGF